MKNRDRGPSAPLAGIACALLVLAAGNGEAASKTWTGAQSGLWSDGRNWQDGSPRYVVPVGSFTSPDVFEGRAYKTHSSSWLYDTYDATKLQASDVGSFVLHFSGTDAATLDYVIEGHSGTVPLSREPF